MAGILAELAVHCRVGASGAFVPGRMDCCTWAADWVMSRTDQDPMVAWRGRYRTALGLKRVLRRSGGMQEMLAAGMRSIGALQIDPAEAVAGDIGMILAISPSGDVEPSAAIRGQLGWLAKLGDGLWRAPSAMAAWRLP